MAVGVNKKRKRKQAQQQAQHRNRQPVREMIGRDDSYSTSRMSIYRPRKSIDATVPNYQFWDTLRRGKAKGYSLGGLFAKRIENIFASWTLGRGFKVTLAESGNAEDDNDPRNYTDGVLADFVNDILNTLLTVEGDKIGLGDQYLVVNVDGSPSIPSPDTVTVVRNEFDYRMVEAYRIETRLDKYVIIDEYRADGRTQTIKEGDKVLNVTEYQNLIGRLPMIHAAHGMSGNEVFGHSVHDELLPLYNEYDDVIYKQLDGAKLLGNPLLAFVGMEDITKVQNANQLSPTDTYYDANGAITDRPQLKIDSNSALLVGKGGDAKFVSPPTGFTGDTQQALKTLFLLLLDHTGIPEFIWGNELSGAHATTAVQMTQWVRDIESRRRSDECWLLELCEIWLVTIALLDPKIVVDALEISWPQLLEEDEKTRLEYVKYAKDSGLLTDKTALELLNLVDDAQEEVTKAKEESDARRLEMFPDGFGNPTSDDTNLDETGTDENINQDTGE